MNKSELNINVSGGNSSFGNVSQGGKANLTCSQTIQIGEADLTRFYQVIDEIAQRETISDSDYIRLRNDVNQLLKDEDQSGFMAKIKHLCETYAWAANPLMALFATVLP